MRKPVYFGKLEGDLLAFANSCENWSEWVKEQIRREQGASKGIDPVIEQFVRDLMASHTGAPVPLMTTPQERAEEGMEEWF